MLHRAASLHGLPISLARASEMRRALLPLMSISPAARAPGPFAAKSGYQRHLIRWLSAQSAGNKSVRGPPRVATNQDRLRLLHR